MKNKRNIRISINLNTFFIIVLLVIIFNIMQTKAILNHVQESSEEIITKQQEILNSYEQILLDQKDENGEQKYYPVPQVTVANGKPVADTLSVKPVQKEKVVEEKKEEPTPATAEPKNTETYSTKLTQHSDLMNFTPITEEDMNEIINKFSSIIGESPFIGRGDVFIKASQESGLNPLYIFAHACLESDYGRSSMARNKGNYFGIGAFDSNPSKALNIRDSMEEGIVSGALWIKKNFYDNNQKTLHEMQFKYPNHIYASAGQKWINDILWIANKYVA